MFFAVVFVLGLAVGSFLNAFLYRMERGESVLRGRSYCPHCRHALSWQELIPLASFLFLRGRCTHCRETVSLQYPLVELAAGVLFLAAFLLVGENLISFSFPQVVEVLYLWVIASLLMAIFVYDFKHFIIPDRVVVPAIGLALSWRVFEFLDFDILNLFGIWNLEFGISPPLAQAILSGLGAGLFFFLIYLLSHGGAMGFGDVKLAFFMGLFLGFPNILPALFVAFVLGGALGFVLVLSGKKNMKSEVPFGPFLVVGTFAALFWGEILVDWYLGLI